MEYCANCGAEIKNSEIQNFCEKCGSSIPASVKQENEEVSLTSATTTTSSTSMGFQPYDRPEGLFDINRNYYVLKEK